MRTIASIPLPALRVVTFKQQQPLTNATGFFFERHNRLFLVTSALVACPSCHYLVAPRILSGSDSLYGRLDILPRLPFVEQIVAKY
jgi:hypothetical protein